MANKNNSNTDTIYHLYSDISVAKFLLEEHFKFDIDCVTNLFPLSRVLRTLHITISLILKGNNHLLLYYNKLTGLNIAVFVCHVEKHILMCCGIICFCKCLYLSE